MEAIMRIQDVFKANEKEIVIGGTNSNYNKLSAKEIRQKIGRQIEVHHPSGLVSRIPVANVEVSDSLLGQKNIFILLPSESFVTKVQEGAFVYSLSVSE